MSKYVLYFSKNGFSKYTSHLDMQRLFKRAFRRAGIALSYSHGFNPHPVMSFAQPLSLGYSADWEMLEFSTDEEYSPEYIKERLKGRLAFGMEVSKVASYTGKKTLAAQMDSAEYEVIIPVPYFDRDYDKVVNNYLGLSKIIALKRQKKTKEYKEVDIKDKIRSLKALPTSGGEGVDIIKNNLLQLNMTLDCGSQSNLSPELIIDTFVKYANLEVTRDQIEVKRVCMHFQPGTEIEEEFGGAQ